MRAAANFCAELGNTRVFDRFARALPEPLHRPLDHPNVRQAFEWIEANKHDMGR
ncbi:MAG: hypothetical protein R3F17_05030 [Planctomycetota bacterium]